MLRKYRYFWLAATQQGGPAQMIALHPEPALLAVGIGIG